MWKSPLRLHSNSSTVVLTRLTSEQHPWGWRTIEDNVAGTRTPGHSQNSSDLPDAADPILVRLLAEVCRRSKAANGYTVP